MDGQRRDATHSTIWLMPRPRLMNYAKLCPRERSHMFIMKAAGVLEIPWVAPNELHVTGWCDTQHGAMKGGGGKTQPSPDLIGCIHQATLTGLWQGSFSFVSTMIHSSVTAEYIQYGQVVWEVHWWIRLPAPGNTCAWCDKLVSWNGEWITSQFFHVIGSILGFDMSFVVPADCIHSALCKENNKYYHIWILSLKLTNHLTLMFPWFVVILKILKDAHKPTM